MKSKISEDKKVKEPKKLENTNFLPGLEPSKEVSEPEDVEKSLNIRVSKETHRRIRILSADKDLTAAELITEFVNDEWRRTSIT